MMKASIVLFVVLGFLSCGASKNSEVTSSAKAQGFCGTASGSKCQSDGDCVRQGCSRQVCQSKTEDPAITTCEWRECYRAESFGVQCGCVEGKCAWR